LAWTSLAARNSLLRLLLGQKGWDLGRAYRFGPGKSASNREIWHDKAYFLAEYVIHVPKVKGRLLGKAGEYIGICTNF